MMMMMGYVMRCMYDCRHEIKLQLRKLFVCTTSLLHTSSGMMKDHKDQVPSRVLDCWPIKLGDSRGSAARRGRIPGPASPDHADRHPTACRACLKSHAQAVVSIEHYSALSSRPCCSLQARSSPQPSTLQRYKEYWQPYTCQRARLVVPTPTRHTRARQHPMQMTQIIRAAHRRTEARAGRRRPPLGRPPVGVDRRPAEPTNGGGAARRRVRGNGSRAPICRYSAFSGSLDRSSSGRACRHPGHRRRPRRARRAMRIHGRLEDRGSTT